MSFLLWVELSAPLETWWGAQSPKRSLEWSHYSIKSRVTDRSQPCVSDASLCSCSGHVPLGWGGAVVWTLIVSMILVSLIFSKWIKTWSCDYEFGFISAVTQFPSRDAPIQRTKLLTIKGAWIGNYVKDPRTPSCPCVSGSGGLWISTAFVNCPWIRNNRKRWMDIF